MDNPAALEKIKQFVFSETGLVYYRDKEAELCYSDVENGGKMEKHVLVIDDEPSVRNSFILALEDTAFSVTTAASGKEGLETFKKTRCHLIFLDLKMPGMNGVETLRELRKLDENVPVYIVSAFAKEFFDGLKELANENIDFELMQKPIGLEAICELTTAVLG